jgi:hypothetical protein
MLRQRRQEEKCLDMGRHGGTGEDMGRQGGAERDTTTSLHDTTVSLGVYQLTASLHDTTVSLSVYQLTASFHDTTVSLSVYQLTTSLHRDKGNQSRDKERQGDKGNMLKHATLVFPLSLMFPLSLRKIPYLTKTVKQHKQGVAECSFPFSLFNLKGRHVKTCSNLLQPAPTCSDLL